jgi:hypothetical protein
LVQHKTFNSVLSENFSEKLQENINLSKIVICSKIWLGLFTNYKNKKKQIGSEPIQSVFETSISLRAVTNRTVRFQVLSNKFNDTPYWFLKCWAETGQNAEQRGVLVQGHAPFLVITPIIGTPKIRSTQTIIQASG